MLSDTRTSEQYGDFLHQPVSTDADAGMGNLVLVTLTGANLPESIVDGGVWNWDSRSCVCWIVRRVYSSRRSPGGLAAWARRVC